MEFTLAWCFKFSYRSNLNSHKPYLNDCKAVEATYPNDCKAVEATYPNDRKTIAANL